MEGRRAPKDAGLHAVRALLPLTRGAPVEPAGAGYFPNGSERSLTLSLSSAMSAASCSLMHFAMVASFRPTAETQRPSAQNLLSPNQTLPLPLAFATLFGLLGFDLACELVHFALAFGFDAEQRAAAAHARLHITVHLHAQLLLDALPSAFEIAGHTRS